jgi:hypothetical protein
MWASPTHWPPGSGRPLRRSSPPTHRSAGSSDEDLRSASAIVTAAEPIWATFPARASKVGVEQRIATHPLVARSGARVRPAATGTARTERRAASARFRPSASARLPVCDAPPAVGGRIAQSCRPAVADIIGARLAADLSGHASWYAPWARQPALVVLVRRDGADLGRAAGERAVRGTAVAAAVATGVTRRPITLRAHGS